MWWPIVRLSVVLLAAVTLLIGSGGGGGSGGTAAANCPADTEKAEVFDIMEIFYLWNDEPDQQSKYLNLNLAGFSDGTDLLDFLRYQPDRFDRGFTYITTVKADEEFFGTGQVAAFGISFREDQGALWLTDVFEGSPAADAGLARGDRIVSIGGRSVANILNSDDLATVLGPPEVGVTRTFMIRFASGMSGSLTLVKQEFAIDPVPDERIRTYSLAGRTIGYLQLRTFVTTANDELRAAFAELGAAGITDIVVDLRYNGGGLISTAQVLGSLLAGTGSTGLTFTELQFNSDLAADGFNDTYRFIAEPAALNLDNLVFITTGASASASELVINSLTPYSFQLDFDVWIVGADTFGKPVGQGGVDYCPDSDTGELTQRLRVVAFETVNVLGEGGYFDGLSVDCAAEDDLDFQLADPAEASLAAAIELIDTGQCSATTTTTPLPGGIQISQQREIGGTAARLAGIW